MEEIRAGTPVVVLEPSVTSVFRDELTSLFPEDERAQSLKRQTFTLGHFLLEEVEGYEPPTLERRAVLHGHCHHKAVLKLDSESRLLMEMGLELDMPDTGCCGMAGAFGFEAGEKYELSVARGEQALLPAVREAGEDALIITDGFSCREQIRQGTDRRAVHTAEVIRMALRGAPAADRERPEEWRDRLASPELPGSTSAVRGAAVLGGVLLLGAAAARELMRTGGGDGDHDGRSRGAAGAGAPTIRGGGVEIGEEWARAEEERERRARRRRREIAEIARGL